MAHIAFPQHAKQHAVSDTVTYSYVFIPAKEHKPTLLFVHGFPSSSYDWRHQISHFSSLGYGVLAPDLLGYGLTSSPPFASEYKYRKMASEVVALLDHEGLGKVHGVAHDWGCGLMSRLVDYYPHRWASVTFASIPYLAPKGLLDVDVLNAVTKKALGWPLFGYWRFMEKVEAGGIILDHFDSFYSLLYAADPSLWRTHLCPVNAFEAWLTSNRTCPIGTYVTAEDKAVHREIFKANGYQPALNWYVAAIRNLNCPDEMELPGPGERLIEAPVLMIRATGDAVVAPGMHEVAQQFMKDSRVESLDGGHWINLEKADEFNKLVKEFVDAH